MTNTKLLYLEDFTSLDCGAKVVDVVQDNHRGVVILDQTIFYPQGGGQPYDKGIIEGSAGKFVVEEVRFVDGVVRHIGRFGLGKFESGEAVRCTVDKERRLLHSRIHSAGHLVDMVVAGLLPTWTPDPRGYHFPEGPYVTYQGSVEGMDRENLKRQIEERCNEAITRGMPVTVRFMEKEEMTKFCRSVPDIIPKDKPGRVVLFGEFGVPCGGTHVSNLSEIRNMTIRKIKAEGQNIRVAYDVVR